MNNIHIYYCDIHQSTIEDARLKRLLNQSERSRYDNFKSKNRQLQFGLARWMIKQVLYREFNVCPRHDYRFSHYCDWVVVGTGQQFSISISHSAQYVAVAITALQCAIGIDIERHKKRNFSELLPEFSTVLEQDIVCCEPNQQLAFYRLWTAKEAFLKASQFSLATVSQQDLSNCLLNNAGQVAGYYYQAGQFADGCYSYCLMIDSPALIQLSVLFCIDVDVEPDVVL